LHAVLPELVQQHDMEFHLIGPIPPTKKLKHERIIYHGQMNDAKEIQSIMDQCHVLVTPSHSEGMPNVIMEGMARGLAVVATDVGAVSAVVDDQNGILIPSINQESLRTSLLEVLSWSNTELDTRRNTSLTKIRGFQWDQIAKRTETEISRRIAH
jgi:glycosyltransferase involved in cell wall biosynthesis